MSDHLDVLVVGAGTIAHEYVKILIHQGHNPIVIGRRERNVEKVKDLYPQIKVYSGGLENWLAENNSPTQAVIATPIDYLAKATKQLLEKGVKKILVEKPLTYSVTEAEELSALARLKDAQVVIAFNRRSYQSVLKARELIELDGGVSSFHFDFTEAVFRIDPKNYSEVTNRYWGIANSSHVIDTAFFLGGFPKSIVCQQYGNGVPWHQSGAIFTGMGETAKGTPFTYHANWGCPGKWNIEIMTSQRKLFFSPMEQLHQQLKGSFKKELVEIDYSMDLEFKPGFGNQLISWMNNDANLMTVQKLPSELTMLRKIFNYT